MKQIRALIIIATIAVILAVQSGRPALCAVYYVDNTQATAADTNAGTSRSAAWRSLAHAAAAAQPGDTVYIAGRYNESFTLAQNGSAGAWTTFASLPGSHPVIVGIAADSHGWHNEVIRIVGSYIEVRGLDVSFPTAANKNGSGIAPIGAHNIRLIGNACHGCGLGGIEAVRSDYLRIIGNTCFDNSATSNWNGSGISLYQCWDYPAALASSPAPSRYHNIIAGNVCYDNAIAPATRVHTDGNGIIIDDPNQTQDGMPAMPNTRRGIRQLGGYLVEDNICYDNGGRGIESGHASNVEIIGNTCCNNERDALVGHEGEITVDESFHVDIRDNIAYARTGAHTVYVYQGAAPRTEIVLRHNLLYNGPATDETMSQWPLDADNVIGDPLFADPGRADFTPAKSGPAGGQLGRFGADVAIAGRPSDIPDALIAAAPAPAAAAESHSSAFQCLIETATAANQPAFQPFAVQTDTQGARYISDPNPADNFPHPSDIRPPDHRAQFPFALSAPQTVRIEMRIIRRTGASAIYASLDSGGPDAAGLPELWAPAATPDAWTWAVWKTIKLAAGNHIIKLMNARAGFGVSQIKMTSNLSDSDGPDRAEKAPETSAADLPAIPPLDSPAPEGVIVDSYDHGMFCGPFHDMRGSTIDVRIVPHPDGKNGSFLFGQYNEVHHGEVGFWSHVGERWNNRQDWSHARSLSLDAFTTQPIAFDIILTSDTGSRYAATAAPTVPGKWQRLSIEIAAFKQIPDGKPEAPLGIVVRMSPHIYTEGSGQFAIDNVVLIDGPSVSTSGAPPAAKRS